MADQRRDLIFIILQSYITVSTSSMANKLLYWRGRNKVSMASKLIYIHHESSSPLYLYIDSLSCVASNY